MTRIEKMMFEHHVPNDLLSPKGMDDRAFAPSFLHQTHYSQDVPSQPTARQSFPKHNDMQTLDDWPPHPKDDSSDGTSTPTPRKQPEQTSEEPLLAQTEFITFLPAAALGLELDLLAIIKHSWARLRRLLARPDLNTLNPSKLLSVKQGLVLHSRELIQVIKHRVQDNSELIQGEAQRRRMGEICSQPMGVMIGNLEDDERGLLRILGEMEYGELVELLRKRKH